MSLHEHLEKAWLAEGRFRTTHRTLTFTDQGLELGNGTLLVKYIQDDWDRRSLDIDGQEERILALLSVAWDHPMPDGILQHFHSASRALAKGEIPLACIHLAHTGLQPLDHDSDSFRLLFMADGFLDAGISGNELRKAWGLGRSNVRKFNPNRYPAGDRRGGQFSPNDGGGGGTSLSPHQGLLHQVSDVTPGTPRKPGDISAETGQKIVDEAKGWEGTKYAPNPDEYPHDPLNIFHGPYAQKGVAADCSGSVHAIMESQGIDYPYTRSDDFADAANHGKIPFRKLDANEEPQPGDVVLYDGHMAIYAGNGKVWSAHRTGKPYKQFNVGTFGDYTVYRPVKRQTA